MKYITLILLFTLSACGNTFDGMGQDMEHLGRKIQGKDDQPDPNRPRPLHQ